MGVSLDQGLRSTERASNRFTKLLRSGLDPQQQVVGLSWTVRQLGAHLAGGATAYREMVVDHAPSPYVDMAQRVATNQQRLEEFDEADLGRVADRIDDQVSKLLAGMQSLHDGDEIGWHGGLSLPVSAFMGAMIGEFTFHGLDLARTAGASWKIDRQEVLPVIDFFNAATPTVVDEKAVEGLAATFEVRYRGYETATFAFRDGSLTVSPGSTERAEVRMSVDPVWLLMVGYGRSGLAKGLVTGKALAWGRKPWLALKFSDYFEKP